MTEQFLDPTDYKQLEQAVAERVALNHFGGARILRLPPWYGMPFAVKHATRDSLRAFMSVAIRNIAALKFGTFRFPHQAYAAAHEFLALYQVPTWVFVHYTDGIYGMDLLQHPYPEVSAYQSAKMREPQLSVSLLTQRFQLIERLPHAGVVHEG